jgi:hypothetical protein
MRGDDWPGLLRAHVQVVPVADLPCPLIVGMLTRGDLVQFAARVIQRPQRFVGEPGSLGPFR